MADSILTMTPVARMLKMNKALPDALRQRSVVLEFLREVPEHRTQEFYNIHLTRQMLAGGEENHFQPEIVQPHRTGKQLCPTCRTMMLQTGPQTWQCVNNVCEQRDGRPTSEFRHVSGPLRGVIRVFTRNIQNKPNIPAPMHFVTGFEKKTLKLGNASKTIDVPMVKGCLLILDRRYREEVLVAVYRTAGELCASLREDGIDISLGV